MPTAAKVETVAQLQQRLERAQSAVLAEFTALSVAEMTALRRKVAEAGGEVKVVKNTLFGLAARAAGVEGLEASLAGPTVVVFAYDDPVAPVRAANEFAQEHREQWRVKAGLLAGRAIDAGEVEALARLPGREQLLAQLAGLLAAPATRLVRTLAEPVAQVARVLAAIEEARRGEAA
ncbi:MAG: 50S ribosomal protein L10 [Firmicutes bacterium]|nr:50S ribosomal protein L10 [Bacillota bacterium]